MKPPKTPPSGVVPQVAPAPPEKAPEPVAPKPSLPKHLFGGVAVKPEDAVARLERGKERAEQMRALGIPEAKAARKPMTKGEELEGLTADAQAEQARMEDSQIRARAGDPEGLKEVADDLLRGTGKDAQSIDEFKKNAFMDGEEAKKIAQKYVAGEISYEEATRSLKKMVRETVTEPTAGEEAPGVVERPGELALSRELVRRRFT